MLDWCIVYVDPCVPDQQERCSEGGRHEKRDGGRRQGPGAREPVQAGVVDRTGRGRRQARQEGVTDTKQGEEGAKLGGRQQKGKGRSGGKKYTKLDIMDFFTVCCRDLARISLPDDYCCNTAHAVDPCSHVHHVLPGDGGDDDVVGTPEEADETADEHLVDPDHPGEEGED